MTLVQQFLLDQENRRKSWLKTFDGVGIVLKSTAVGVWMVVLLLTLLEVKRYYNIDVIPGYDSPIDDAYGAVRGTLSNILKAFQ